MSLLLDAVRRCDLGQVTRLLKNGAEINAEMEGSWVTVLDEAAFWGHTEMVQLLINHGANLDTPVRSDTRMTVFQNAVNDEYEVIVELMIQAGADVNAPAGERGGRTALQAAVMKGNMALVELLLDSEARIDALGAERGGRNALQAAAGSGNKTLVELLIKRGADVNAPAVERAGRTALQAAAENGKLSLVEFLIGVGADIDAPAGKYDGRTALQAAAGRGHDTIVELLLSKKANPNAPPGETDGKTALRAAIDWNGYLQGARDNDDNEKQDHRFRVVKLLLDAKAIGHEVKDSEGRNALHALCLGGTGVTLPFDPRILNLLLPISTPRVLNAKDFSGSTPLHCAVRQKNRAAVELLLQKNLNLEIKDNSRRTVLQIAFPDNGIDVVADDDDNSDIPKLLLKYGARTDGLLLNDLPTLQQLCGNRQGDIVILRDDMTKGTNVASALGDVTYVSNTSFDSPSIYFCSSTPKPSTPNGYSFVHPSSFGATFKTTESVSLGVHWGGSFLGGVLQLAGGIPDPQEIVSHKVVLVGYVFFDCPVEQKSTIHSGSRPFKLASERVEMSWIMKQEKGASFLRSVQYRRSLPMKHLIIPQNVVHFATLFLGDLHERWKVVIENAKEYLVRRRDDQLSNAGKIHGTITGLLEDSKQWSMLRKDWQKTFNSATELLAQLKEQDIFFQDVRDPWEFRKDYQSKAEDTKMKLLQKKERGSATTAKLVAARPAADSPDDPKGKTVSDKEHGAKEPTAGNSKNESIKHQGVGGSKEPDSTKEPNPKPAPKVVPAPEGEPAAADPKAVVPEGGYIAETSKAPIKPLIPVLVEQQNDVGPKVTGVKSTKVTKMDDLEAMKKLSKLFRIMQRECELGITELEKETAEMIGLEFNLISIFEARRSIEASVSMKRLSWITFIFLPLMFISGVFGMNVNILQGTPPAWQWYFVVVVPFSAMVILVWILCKYLPGIKSLEKRLDNFLKTLFGSDEDDENSGVKPVAGKQSAIRTTEAPIQPSSNSIHTPNSIHNITSRRTPIADEEKRIGG